MITVLLWLCLGGLWIAGVYGFYQVAVSLRFLGDLPALPDPDERHRFAILVFARNEELVIGQLLESLRGQDYPDDRYQVFVTADNCTDATAAVARAGGAVVYERSSQGATGKGAALTWFFAEHAPVGFDACVVFDADNVVDAGFLAAMNRQLAAGHPIAAGYRMGKNPSSSWVAGASTLFWLMQTRFFHLPRARRNLPCTTVGGTGFMFALSVLGPDGWRTSSASEDIEFTLNAIADGWFVALAPDAVFYDEQPLTLVQSLQQRYRWSVGSVQLLSSVLPRLAGGVGQGRLRTIDAVLYSVGVIVGGLSGVLWLISVGLGVLAGADLGQVAIMLVVSTVLGYLVMAAFAVLVLRLERRSWPGVTRAVLGFPIWLFSWSLINMLVVFYRDPTWRVLPHTEALSLAETTQPGSGRP